MLGVNAEASNLTLPEWAKHCANLRQSTSLSDRSKQALTLNVTDFFSHEVWVPFHPAPGSGPGGVDLPPTAYLREPASAAMLHLTWAGDLAFASSDSLAPTARLFGYTGGLITSAQRSAFGQADLVLCDLFVRLSQGAENSNPEEDAIEITEGWRNTQWPDCMVTLPKQGPASAVDMKRMFDYARNSNWQNFKTKSIAASASSPEMRALFPRETNPAKVEATLLQLAPPDMFQHKDGQGIRVGLKERTAAVLDEIGRNTTYLLVDASGCAAAVFARGVYSAPAKLGKRVLLLLNACMGLGRGFAKVYTSHLLHHL